MGAAEVFLAWLVGAGAAVAALVAIIGGVPKLWRFTRKFVSTVDVIASLPETLGAMDQRLADHVTDATARETQLSAALYARAEAIDAKFRELVTLTTDVRHEVKSNGGSSLKDGVDQIRAGVEGLYARPGEQGAPGRTPTAPIPTTPVKRSRRPKPEPRT